MTEMESRATVIDYGCKLCLSLIIMVLSLVFLRVWLVDANPLKLVTSYTLLIGVPVCWLLVVVIRRRPGSMRLYFFALVVLFVGTLLASLARQAVLEFITGGLFSGLLVIYNLTGATSDMLTSLLDKLAHRSAAKRNNVGEAGND